MASDNDARMTASANRHLPLDVALDDGGVEVLDVVDVQHPVRVVCVGHDKLARFGKNDSGWRCASAPGGVECGFRLSGLVPAAGGSGPQTRGHIEPDAAAGTVSPLRKWPVAGGLRIRFVLPAAEGTIRGAAEDPDLPARPPSSSAMSRTGTPQLAHVLAERADLGDERGVQEERDRDVESNEHCERSVRDHGRGPSPVVVAAFAGRTAHRDRRRSALKPANGRQGRPAAADAAGS